MWVQVVGVLARKKEWRVLSNTGSCCILLYLMKRKVQWMHCKVNSSHCSFHLLGNILWDWLKALSGLAGASLPFLCRKCGTAPFLAYLLIKRSVYRKLCFAPTLRKATSASLLKALVMGSVSHYQQAAKCVWNGKFLFEMGISELPAAGDRVAEPIATFAISLQKLLI